MPIVERPSNDRRLWYDFSIGAIDTVTIRLNGDQHELPGPLTVAALLERLEIDSRRVEVELNLTVVKRAAYGSATIGDGDEVEVVNFVGGG